MQYRLYEVAILEQAKRTKDDGEGGIPKVIVAPECIIARNDQDAAVKAALKFAIKLKDADPERIDFIVRPF